MITASADPIVQEPGTSAEPEQPTKESSDFETARSWIADQLADLRGRLTNAALDELAVLAKVRPMTMRRWVRVNLPIGWNFVKLVSVLELLGYETKLSARTAPIVALGRCVLFDLMTLTQCANILGVSESGCYRILTGRSQPRKVSSQSARRFLATVYPKLLQCETEFVGATQRYRIGPPSTTPELTEELAHEAAVQAAEAEPHENGDFVLANDATIDVFAHLVAALLPLAKRITSNEFSPREREILRQRSGKFSIFELKNLLTKLCGERARTDL